ncbi:hypothetical protein M3664_04220 [Paenibacillus lautus]|uniref:hypothetical protein n=1 Tax=Paenibacillus lautus TaxID=1401 RepID=UPI00203F3C0F|nr:hypothetical protein [Paenibacillus lautus]MCM3256985.1 hypothetical protein [Paenibacillus lautus]
MKLYKYELEAFITFLHSLKLERKNSRMRSKLKKILTGKLQEFYEDLYEINLNYAKKDDSGNPIQNDGKFLFSDDNNRLEDLYELANEVVIIDVNDETRDMLFSVKESVIYNAPLEFEGEDADKYDRFCEIVEQIN